MAIQTTTYFDIEDTVNQLIAMERQPLDKTIEKRDSLEKQKTVYDLLKSTLNTLQVSLDSLRSPSTFQTKSVNVSDTSVITASAAVGASDIYYDIVVSAVATAARVESDAALNLEAGTKTAITGNDVKGAGSVNANALITSGLGLDNGEITAGSFVINGVTIEVFESDTINTILSRITSSGAGVTAYIDGDVVIFQQKTAGSNYDIELESDSTNFFSAMKVTEGARASKTDGVDQDLYRNIVDVQGDGRLAGITSGYFTINNVTFYVDINNDSLSDVINRVNSSAANVSMFYDSTLDKVVVTSDIEGEDINFKNDSTSNFLDTLNILDVAGSDQDGTAGVSRYEGTAATVHVNGSTLHPESNQFTILGTTFNIVSAGKAKVGVVADDEHLKDKITNFVDQFNNTITFLKQKRDNELSKDSSLTYMINALINKVQSSISNTGNYTNLARVGLSMGRGSESGKLAFDTNTLDEALLTDRDSVMKLFAYDSNSDGLYDDGGFSNTLYSYLNDYTRSGVGIIYKKKTVIDTLVEQMDVTIRRKEAQMEKRRSSLTAQFIAVNRALQLMEQRIQAINQTLSNNIALASGQYLL